MIHKIEAYTGECDHCGADFEHPHWGWTIFMDVKNMGDEMMNAGWHIGDGEEGEKGKYYCPDCWSRDDDDIFKLTPSPVEAVIGMVVSIHEDVVKHGKIVVLKPGSAIIEIYEKDDHVVLYSYRYLRTDGGAKVLPPKK